jgi:hypothetical protein
MANAGDDGSHEQQPGSRSRGFIPPHGGYEDLLTFRKTRIIYDGTVRFCDRFVDFRSRTRESTTRHSGIATVKRPCLCGNWVRVKGWTMKPFANTLTRVRRR